MDRGFFLTRQAMRRQLAAMPCDLYRIRLIHSRTRQPDPGERIWSSCQLLHGATISFLRLRNRQGFDVFFHPFAGPQNAGYILVDLDHPESRTLDTMRAQGHAPCVVLQSSPGHLQAWVHVSSSPLAPSVATAIGKHLARSYGGDLASTDWHHLGRLAGFTNQKPTRRHPNGYAPWVKLLHTQAGLAPHAEALVEAAQHCGSPPHPLPIHGLAPAASIRCPAGSPSCLTPTAAAAIYSRCLHRLRIPQRFPHPDWSIADLWIAKQLLASRIPIPQIYAILRLGSPGFPRRHSDPDDYLRRTLARAAHQRPLTTPFSARTSPPPASQ